jgi:hypothetical protein
MKHVSVQTCTASEFTEWQDLTGKKMCAGRSRARRCQGRPRAGDLLGMVIGLGSLRSQGAGIRRGTQDLQRDERDFLYNDVQNPFSDRGRVSRSKCGVRTCERPGQHDGRHGRPFHNASPVEGIDLLDIMIHRGVCVVQEAPQVHKSDCMQLS